jgi:hypothetical protein
VPHLQAEVEQRAAWLDDVHHVRREAQLQVHLLHLARLNVKVLKHVVAAQRNRHRHVSQNHSKVGAAAPSNQQSSSFHGVSHGRAYVQHAHDNSKSHVRCCRQTSRICKKSFILPQTPGPLPWLAGCRAHLGVIESMAVTSTLISGLSSWCLRMLATLQQQRQKS